ncbi:hypothetical protein F5Y16DRAFT_390698 [Xylariaceae sp. FL0255]|nr:hypothetical protein F5Y16DRAFT_390698 [Xylariaceae sp. FL0255]
MDEASANRAVEQAALVSQKIREALQASLPVAQEQLMTVQIPGTIIDTSETGPYVWNDREESDTPHRIMVNEARLVDNMVPLSKVMMGVTGKSVARSYLAALDMLIPEDAPIDSDKTTSSKTAAAERYVGAMKYLTGPAPGSSMSIIDVYVEKQQKYSEAMDKWEHAKTQARTTAKERFPGNVREQQRFYDDWNQENFRNFKNNAQAKYMDWVVNGNKYKVDYYFGIVDVSSAMKRVESSKESSRNLVVIDPDGSTEWQQIRLTPANWATLCKEKVDSWSSKNGRLSRKDFESEVKRLNRLLLSYEGLLTHIDGDGAIQKAIEAKTAIPGEDEQVEPVQEQAPDPDEKAVEGESEEDKKKRLQRVEDRKNSNLPQRSTELKNAYKDLYDAQNSPNPANLLTIRDRQDKLQVALENYSKANMETNKNIASRLATKSKGQKVRWIQTMIEDVKGQIKLLKQGQEDFFKTSSSSTAITEVMKKDADGGAAKDETALVSTQYADTDSQYADAKFGIPRNGVAVVKPEKTQPNKWTKISLSISSSKQESSTEKSSSSTAASVNASGWWWNASASFNHSQAAQKASEAASSCNVDISFEALLVTIDRAWLHGELFSDPELNTSPDVALSPGSISLHKYIDLKDSESLAKYPYFPSYPTSFIVASNIELEFRGDTTKLEEAVESSHTDAQAKIGYGPFSISASHSQDKSSAKTKMETTATGTRISLEAPAIIGWVSQLVPQLPRPKGTNFLIGPMV